MILPFDLKIKLDVPISVVTDCIDLHSQKHEEFQGSAKEEMISYVIERILIKLLVPQTLQDVKVVEEVVKKATDNIKGFIETNDN